MNKIKEWVKRNKFGLGLIFYPLILLLICNALANLLY